MSTLGLAGTNSADPTALRVYVRVTRDMDHELLLFARGPLRAALTDYRAACPDAGRALPDLGRLVEDLATRCLRLSDMVDRVAADFDAAGQGADLRDLLLPQVAGDTAALLAQPEDPAPLARVASLPVGPAAPPVPPEDSLDVAGDFLGGAWDEVAGTLDGLISAGLHPMEAAKGLIGMVENPGEAFRALIDWEDLEGGHLGRWLGHMTPGLLFGALTGGGGFFIRAARLLRRFSVETQALRAAVGALAVEVGEHDARLLVARLRTKLSSAEIRQFIDELGPARVRELADRYGADTMSYYGAEFFKEFRGVTEDTMRHVVPGDGINNGRILGCHDPELFRHAIEGNGVVLSEISDPFHPQLVRFTYMLYKRANGQVRQPPEFTGKVRRKTAIKGLASDRELWRSIATDAVDDAIRKRLLPRAGGEFEVRAANGVDLLLYYRAHEIKSFFPR